MVFLLLIRESGLNSALYSVRFSKSFNLIPFYTIRLFLRTLHRPFRRKIVQQSLINLIGNVVLFIPMGIFPPLLAERFRRYWKTALLCSEIIIAVELLQALLLVGKCDIDDLILNLLGASIGYWIYKTVSHTNAPQS